FCFFFFFFQAEDGIRDRTVTGVQTCALPISYPGNYKNFLDQHRELSAAAEHHGNVLDIQARGEYAYAALGPGGFRVYDIANIDRSEERRVGKECRSRWSPYS